MQHTILQRLLRPVIYTLVSIVFIFIILIGFRVLPCVPTRIMTIEQRSFAVCVSDTQASQMQGLSHTRNLPDWMAMLFVFDTPASYPFWMPDMNYDIDILWLNDDFSVANIYRSASPRDYPAHYIPDVPVRYVIETAPDVVRGSFPQVQLGEN